MSDPSTTFCGDKGEPSSFSRKESFNLSSTSVRIVWRGSATADIEQISRVLRIPKRKRSVSPGVPVQVSEPEDPLFSEDFNPLSIKKTASSDSLDNPESDIVAPQERKSRKKSFELEFTNMPSVKNLKSLFETSKDKTDPKLDSFTRGSAASFSATGGERKPHLKKPLEKAKSFGGKTELVGLPELAARKTDKDRKPQVKNLKDFFERSLSTPAESEIGFEDKFVGNVYSKINAKVTTEVTMISNLERDNFHKQERNVSLDNTDDIKAKPQIEIIENNKELESIPSKHKEDTFIASLSVLKMKERWESLTKRKATDEKMVVSAVSTPNITMIAKSDAKKTASFWSQVARDNVSNLNEQRDTDLEGTLNLSVRDITKLFENKNAGTSFKSIRSVSTPTLKEETHTALEFKSSFPKREEQFDHAPIASKSLIGQSESMENVQGQENSSKVTIERTASVVALLKKFEGNREKGGLQTSKMIDSSIATKKTFSRTKSDVHERLDQVSDFGRPSKRTASVSYDTSHINERENFKPRSMSELKYYDFNQKVDRGLKMSKSKSKDETIEADKEKVKKEMIPVKDKKEKGKLTKKKSVDDNIAKSKYENQSINVDRTNLYSLKLESEIDRSDSQQERVAIEHDLTSISKNIKENIEKSRKMPEPKAAALTNSEPKPPPALDEVENLSKNTCPEIRNNEPVTPMEEIHSSPSKDMKTISDFEKSEEDEEPKHSIDISPVINLKEQQQAITPDVATKTPVSDPMVSPKPETNVVESTKSDIHSAKEEHDSPKLSEEEREVDDDLLVTTKAKRSFSSSLTIPDGHHKLRDLKEDEMKMFQGSFDVSTYSFTTAEMNHSRDRSSTVASSNPSQDATAKVHLDSTNKPLGSNKLRHLHPDELKYFFPSAGTETNRPRSASHNILARTAMKESITKIERDKNPLE